MTTSCEKRAMRSGRSLSRTFLWAFLCLTALDVFQLQATAADYYVAPGGDDSNPGTEAQPWANPGFSVSAASPVLPGDTVYLRDGVYHGQVVFHKTGSPDKWITVKNYPSEAPVIDGSLNITGWIQAGSSDPHLSVLGTVNPNYARIYWARVVADRLPSKLEDTILFEDGVRNSICSDPKQSEPFGEDPDEFRNVSAASHGQKDYLIDTTLGQADDFWNGATVRLHLRSYNANTVSATVSDYSSSSRRLALSASLPATISSDATHQDAYRFVNHPHLITQSGEFYISEIENIAGVDYRRIYMWPTSTANLTNKISIPYYDYGVRASGAKALYLAIEGVTIRGTSSHGMSFDGVSDVSRLSHVTIKNCTVHDTGQTGINFAYANDCKVEDCTTLRCSNRGLMGSNCTRVVFKGCNSRDTKSTNISFYNAKDSMIIYCTLRGIRGGHGNGTSVYGMVGISYLCQNILLGGNTYLNCNMAFNNCQNLTIFGNLFDHNHSSPGQAITYWASRFDGFHVCMNNTIPVESTTQAHSLMDAYSVNYLPSHYVANNVLYGINKDWAQGWDAWDSQEVIVEDRSYNAYTGYGWTQKLAQGWALNVGEQDLRNTNLTEIFNSPVHENGDYRPKANGPIHGQGKNVQTVLSDLGIIAAFPEFDFTKDLAGNPWASTPSIGCFESGGLTNLETPSDPPSSNRPPVMALIEDQTTTTGTRLSFSVTATDPDGDAIQFSVSSLPISGASFSDQTFSWTPNNDQIGSHRLVFAVSDGEFSDSEYVTITVSELESEAAFNKPPVMTLIEDQATTTGTMLSFSVTATDPDGDAIQYSASSLPSGASFSNQTLSWTPNSNQIGSHRLVFAVSDGELSDSEYVTITVSELVTGAAFNKPPVMTFIEDQTTTTGTTLSISVTATDPDGDAIQFSVSSLPSGASFNGQTFSWTPINSQVGSHRLMFAVSDGEFSDSEYVTITITESVTGTDSVSDTTKPIITERVPEIDAFQVPLNSLVALAISDSDAGVDASSVIIRLDNTVIYTGDTDCYKGSLGDCHRSGTIASYRYSFQPDSLLDFDQQMAVTVDASDLAGNTMSRQSYSFSTEMRSYGKNNIVAAGEHASTAIDNNRMVWAAWHAGPVGSRDIYISQLNATTGRFSDAVQLTIQASDQCYPDLAIDADNRLYVTWQDNSNGNWDIYQCTSLNGNTWSTHAQVTDSQGNQTVPAIAINAYGLTYIVWQDDRNGNPDIYGAYSNNRFNSRTEFAVSTNGAAQYDPVIAIDNNSEVSVVWTDTRGGSHDIYGAGSGNSWADMPIVTGIAHQKSPTLAADPSGTTLHMAWVDHTPGNWDIYYANSDGLPGNPISGSNVVDDTSGAEQEEPSIAATRNNRGALRVHLCWTDHRPVGGSTDTDLYFLDLSSGNAGTNILVGDHSTGANQKDPAIGIDAQGEPYLIWTDDRGSENEIYYCGSTYVVSQALDSGQISAAEGGQLGPVVSAISGTDDISVVVPAGAVRSDITISISEIRNPPSFENRYITGYEFGPSGMAFTQPVTISIPYRISEVGANAMPYWYSSLADSLAQSGISDVQKTRITDDLYVLQFRTTHFTPYYLVDTATSSGGASGGGCALEPFFDASPMNFFFPYVGILAVLAYLRSRDRKRLAANETTLKQRHI